MNSIRAYKLFYTAIKIQNYELAQEISENTSQFGIVATVFNVSSMPNASSSIFKYKSQISLNEQVKNKDEILWIIYNDDNTLYTIIGYNIKQKDVYYVNNRFDIQGVINITGNANQAKFVIAHQFRGVFPKQIAKFHNYTIVSTTPEL